MQTVLSLVYREKIALSSLIWHDYVMCVTNNRWWHTSPGLSETVSPTSFLQSTSQQQQDNINYVIQVTSNNSQQQWIIILYFWHLQYSASGDKNYLNYILKFSKNPTFQFCLQLYLVVWWRISESYQQKITLNIRLQLGVSRSGSSQHNQESQLKKKSSEEVASAVSRGCWSNN